MLSVHGDYRGTIKIKIEPRKREGRNKFKEIDMAAYAKKMFNMFDGEEQNVEILDKDLKYERRLMDS